MMLASRSYRLFPIPDTRSSSLLDSAVRATLLSSQMARKGYLVGLGVDNDADGVVGAQSQDLRVLFLLSTAGLMDGIVNLSVGLLGFVLVGRWSE
ncbi:hypothetical protein JAAARDRAFT_617919 [Jaapia argillacea MUCL 33604]|uniref:Uncharacterized protein n=1 Tax=Jaapia argillacea MUCL 33604 TaxID=933084 RepID=A0A067PF45_9AGAM|nr:hypothetical protein JAAARDRAFT_617919 [Jaapia argillacea MUCL 33604]